MIDCGAKSGQGVNPIEDGANFFPRGAILAGGYIEAGVRLALAVHNPLILSSAP